MGYVGEVKIGNDTHLVGSTLYGTCGSAANAAEKSVTCANFSNLMNNITIHVKFTNTNTATNPTLNVNGTGAKRIYRYGTTAPGNSTITSWNAGSVVSFTYDGSSWMMNDAFDGQQLKTDLQNSFQAGVDSVYDAVVAEGSTPASKSLSDVVAGIHAIPNKNTETFPATTREAAKDMGYNNKYRYVNTTGVPNSCTATYPNAFTTNGQKDLGATHNYRYININVPNPSSGTINITANGNYDVTSKATAAVAVPASAVVSGTINITTNGTTDVTTYKNANVQVPASAVVSGTYTYPAGSTGGTVDVTNYKNANADNVYTKGKADGHAEVDYIMLGGTGWDWNEGYVELNYTCTKKGVLMCFFPPMPGYKSTITKNGVEIPREGVPCDAGLNVGDHYQLYCMGRQRAGEGQMPFRITSVSAGDQLYIKFNSMDDWRMTAIFAFIVYTE